MLNFCSKVEKVFKRAGNVKYCSKFKKVLKKCPAPSGNAYFLAQIFKILAGELRYLNTEPVQWDSKARRKTVAKTFKLFKVPFI